MVLIWPLVASLHFSSLGDADWKEASNAGIANVRPHCSSTFVAEQRVCQSLTDMSNFSVSSTMLQ